MPGQSGVGGRTAEFIRKRQERRGQGGASPSPAGGQPPAPGGKGQSLGVQRRLCAFFRRLMVHLGAIFASAGITGVLGIGDEATGGAMMLLYLGFINLIPPGSPREHTFYVPAGVGLAQALAALILGVPLPVAVFLGGAQSFLQRGILHKGALGFGWSALPFLLAGLYAAISGLGSLGALAVPLGVFLAFSLGGALFQHFYVRRQAEAFLRRKLQQILSDLERYSIEQRLTARLREALLRLKGLVGEYLPSADLSSGKADFMLEKVEGVHSELLGVCDAAAIKGPLALVGLQRGAAGKVNVVEESLADRMDELSEEFLELRRRREAERPAAPDAFTHFDEEAAALVQRARELPEGLRASVEAIVASTTEILRQMRSDERDRSPGDRFLSRYLPATAQIVDEYLRLSAERSQGEELRSALSRSGEVLERLRVAFAEECEHMLQNDSVDFMAELNALDAFLKMHGH